MFLSEGRLTTAMHGEERNKRHIVDNGRIEFERREKFCARHGWIDVLAIGGVCAWHDRHDDCEASVCEDRPPRPN